MASYASDLVGLGIKVGDVISQDFYDMLSSGNQAVYNDIYWQHLIYKEKGLPGLYLSYLNGNINEQQYFGWSKIDNGSSNKDNNDVWAGATDLLQYEQESILQKSVYDRYPKLSVVLSPFMISPIPDPNNNVINKLFQKSVPGGNIGNYPQRWKWVSGTMLQEWKDLSTKHPDIINSDFNRNIQNANEVCHD